jgi:hypothetical protein
LLGGGGTQSTRVPVLLPSNWAQHPMIRRGRATATTVGLDIAKSVFQVHGVDADDNVVVCRRLRRRYVLTFFQKLLPCFDDFRTGVLFAAAVIR